MSKETKSESEASIIGGLVLACGNVYNEQGTQISKEVGQYIFSQRQKDREKVLLEIGEIKKLFLGNGLVKEKWVATSLADLEQAINKIMK